MEDVRNAAVATPIPSRATVVTGMNDVINRQGYTQAARWNRIPTAGLGPHGGHRRVQQFPHRLRREETPTTMCSWLSLSQSLSLSSSSPISTAPREGWYGLPRKT